MTEFDSFDLELFVNKKWKTDCALARELIPSLKEVVKKGEENLAVNLENLAADKGLKKGQVLWIFRIAITGAQSTPGGATEMAHLLGEKKCLERLEKVYARLSK